jgi:hypothetical protein
VDETVAGRHFRSSVMAQAIGTGSSFRVSAKGSIASTGGIEGSTLAYSQGGDIALIDLSTQTALPVPDGVNSKAAEYDVSMSGTSRLFARQARPHSYSVVLFDTSSGTTQVIYSHRDTPNRRAFLVTDQLNGNFAVWDQDVYNRKFVEVRCNVWMYDIAQGTTTKLPSSDGVCQYGAGVSSDGTLYFGRSRMRCGQNAQVVMLPLGGSESVLYSLPKESRLQWHERRRLRGRDDRPLFQPRRLQDGS